MNSVLNSHNVSRSLMQRIKARRDDPRDIYGYSWGFPTLDYLTGGIQEGLTVLGAETGAGKSLLSGQVTESVARQLAGTGKVVRVIQCEMTAEQFQQRLIAQIAQVSERRIRAGRVSDEEYARIHAAALTLADLPIEYLEAPGSIEETVEFIQRGGNCGWFLVDHAQAHATNRPQQTGLDFRTIGELAVALGLVANRIPGLLLSQITNEVGKREDHRPTKADLYGGKALQQPASLILMLYRPDIYQRQDEVKRLEPKRAHMYIEKNRWTSEVGGVKLLWEPNRALFSDDDFKSGG